MITHFKFQGKSLGNVEVVHSTNICKDTTLYGYVKGQMKESMGMKIVSCSSTLYDDHIFKFQSNSFRNLEVVCSKNMIHVNRFTVNQPTDPYIPPANFIAGV